MRMFIQMLVGIMRYWVIIKLLEFSLSLELTSESFDQQMPLSLFCHIVKVMGCASAKFLTSEVELLA